jgi:hypothetical protein
MNKEEEELNKSNYNVNNDKSNKGNVIKYIIINN